MFMLLVIEKQKHIDVLGKEVALPLKWADGMIGAIPVFIGERKEVGTMEEKYTGYVKQEDYDRMRKAFAQAYVDSLSVIYEISLFDRIFRWSKKLTEKGNMFFHQVEAHENREVEE